MQLKERPPKGYIIDCDYIIRVKDYHQIIPLISIEVNLWENE